MGLNHFSIELPDRKEYEMTINNLQDARVAIDSRGEPQGNGIFVIDNDGIEIRLYYKKPSTSNPEQRSPFSLLNEKQSD